MTDQNNGELEGEVRPEPVLEHHNPILNPLQPAVAMVVLGGKHEVYSGKNPEEFSDWVDRLVHLSEANEWGGPKTLKVLPAYLKDYALQVHTSVLREKENDEAVNSMAKVKALMLKKIMPEERCMLWKIQFRGLRREPGESIDAFIFRLRRQAQKAHKNVAVANREEAINQAIREQFILGQNKELEYTLLREKDTVNEEVQSEQEQVQTNESKRTQATTSKHRLPKTKSSGHIIMYTCSCAV